MRFTLPAKLSFPALAKRLALLFALALVLAVCVQSLPAYAATSLTNQISGNFKYTAYPDTLTAIITGYTGSGETEVTIPANFGVYRVAGVSGSPFRSTGIKKLYLPDNLTTAVNVDDTTDRYCSADSETARHVGTFISQNNTNYKIKILSNKTIQIVSYLGGASSLSIPSKIDGVNVTAIGNSVASGNTSITSLTIPGTVTSIYAQAFYKCSNLSSVSLPQSVTYIDSSAFAQTALTQVTLPEKLTYLPASAFDSSVTRICHAGTDTAALGSVGNFVSPSEPDYVIDENGGVLTIVKYNGKASALSIPSTIDGVNVTSIRSQAVASNTSITSLTVPGTVTSIYSQAFYKCSNLSSVSLPQSVTYIDSSAFAQTALTKVTLPEKLTYLPNSAFDSSVTRICHAGTDTAALGSVGNFVSPSEPDYVIDENGGVLTIVKYTGSASALSIPSKIDGVNVTSIKSQAAASNTSITSLTVPGTVTSIYAHAFYKCSNLSSVSLPQSVTYIDSSAFAQTALTKVTLPEKLTYLPNSAFDSSVTRICHAGTATAALGSVANFVSPSEPDYVIDENGGVLTIVKYTGKGTSFTVPKTIDGVTVSTVNSKAFPTGLVFDADSFTVRPAVAVNSVKFSKIKATVNQKVTITCETNTLAVNLDMYAGSKLIKSWSSGYTDSGDVRTWKVTYSFGGAGNDRVMTFKAVDAGGLNSLAKTAKITITPAPVLKSVAFSRSTATVKQNVTITATTSLNTSKLNMYNGSSLVKSWTTGYTDTSTTRTWKVTYAFSGAGARSLNFKAVDDNGFATAAKAATITVTAAPTLSSVKFSKTTVTAKQNVTITAVTNTAVAKLNMYAGSVLAQSWTSGYTDSGSTRTWKVTYAFGTAGADRVLSFKGVDGNGITTAAKSATITVAAAPALSSVKFNSATAAPKQAVSITAVTNTAATKLVMYAENGAAAQTWTTGYTDSGTKRTWNVSFSFAGSGDRSMIFKAFNAGGTASEKKTAAIKIAAAPTLSSVKFGAASVQVKKSVSITAVTNTSATKLVMYAESGAAAQTWTSGYTDSGSTRTWNVSFSFSGTGDRTMGFKAFDASGKASDKKTAAVKVVAAPTLSLNSVQFATSSVAVKENVVVIAVTSTNAAKLTMYTPNGTAVKSWTSGYSDSGSTRTWYVTYAFSGAGSRTLSFKAFDANGTGTGAKTASITVVK